MKEVIQQKFWVHNRGIELLLPPQARPSATGQEMNRRENQRLYQITQDGPLKRRYPTPEEGRRFMEVIDFDRRNILLREAGQATDVIVEEWKQINPDKPIAVVLFGSTAKGTVKDCSYPDPSNIDMGVIGDISPEEQELLFDAIRPYREQVQERLLETCGDIQTDEKNPGNLGVSIQHVNKLTNGHYSGMVCYLGSSALPLSDPENIWGKLEDDALDKLATLRENKGNRKIYTASKEWRNAERTALNQARRSEKATLPQEDVVFTQPRLF